MIRIALTKAFFRPGFSNFLIKLTVHFCMFLYLLTHYLRVTVLLLCQLQVVSKLHVPICPYLISEKRQKNFNLVTGSAIKLWLSGNMLPNIKTCKKILSNFSQNLRIMALKLIEFTQFLSPNLSIYINLL